MLRSAKYYKIKEIYSLQTKTCDSYDQDFLKSFENKCIKKSRSPKVFSLVSIHFLMISALTPKSLNFYMSVEAGLNWFTEP